MKPFEKATRRSFFRAVGAGAATLPFYRMLEDSVAKAAGATLPLRFIGLYHPHGVSAELWAMQAGDTESKFDLTYTKNGGQCSLQPFDDAATYGKSFKDKIRRSGRRPPCRTPIANDSAGDNPDWQPDGFVGEETEELVDRSVFGRRAESRRGHPGNQRLARHAGQQHHRLRHHAVVRSRRHAAAQNHRPGAGVQHAIRELRATDDPAAQAAALRHRALGRERGRLREGRHQWPLPEAGPPEQQKLQQHLDSLRDLEKQSMPPPRGRGRLYASGTAGREQVSHLKQYNQGEPYFDAITNAFLDILAQAFACDITRFATLFMADLVVQRNPLGLPTEQPRGRRPHLQRLRPRLGRPPGGDRRSPARRCSPSSIGTPTGRCVLMQKLDAAGALDNVLIYASSDMGNPALHSTRNVSTLLAGGANGIFRMGRRLKMAADCPSASPWCSPTDATFTATANSKLLVSIAQAFGQTDVTTWDADEPGLDRRHPVQPDLTRSGASGIGPAFPGRFRTPGNALSSFC